jgi:hypothetical protein
METTTWWKRDEARYLEIQLTWHRMTSWFCDNFRMNTCYGRYGATYSMIGLRCFNEELSLLPKNPTEAKLQATSTRGESTEPT